MTTQPPRTSPRVRRILVATDFSESAGRGLSVAVDLAARMGCALTLVHVRDPGVLPAVDGLNVSIAALHDGAAAALEGAVRQTRVRHLDVEGMLADGDPAGGILEAAVRSKADLIVIGSHGRTGLERFLLGSVAERVVRQAEVPVLTVPARGALGTLGAGSVGLG